MDEKKRWEEEDYAPLPLRDANFTTISGEELEPLYTPQDIEGMDYDGDLGYPGRFPFTRGIQTSMYRGRLWTMRQFSGFGSVEDTNQRYKFLLEKGQTGLSVAFDMPTIMGRDSDDPLARGEVGRCGVAVDSLKDMENLFAGIPLKNITTSMTINGPACALLAFYLCVGEEQGASFEELGGTIQNDILKEYIAQKSWIFPPRPSMRITTDILDFCSREVPRWNTISISGYHIREAGSTAEQELAFTLADGFAYVEAAIEAGLDVDDFAPRLSFFFNSHMDFFEEIAKYRAARRIWARHMKEKYGAKDPRSWMLRFHTQTAGCSLTAQQPENNIVRTAFQALSAVLGGTQSLHTNSMDETLALPTEKAAEIALRTQQIVAHETGAISVIDPLAGSYFIESLTNRMEEKAEAYFRRIDELGGVAAAIDKGFFQREIADAAYRYQREVEKGERVVVGVNFFQNPEEELTIDLLRIDPDVEKKQCERLAKLRSARSAAKADQALEALKRGAEGDPNLMPLIIDCARAYCTEGEIIGTLRRVFGEYRETPLF
ncbi:MAG: methylmalonyl-CoA mutase [Candidatus Solincola sediminis]|uniref:Methylmalonyl-CoA mutase n=1 Tax=Candidatus Solincola sediminis TaxID=1797199 RepID=A0A1F2WKH2_9ACTN|nr:MAG: methylmalonyl-CoA mutase [Candidatus Solincola sediminis]OFW57349.1 MAG: methylmalonyl-CoA mutase [Candidatus Solincola sediminis]